MARQPPKGLKSLVECMARATISAHPADMPDFLVEYTSELNQTRGSKTESNPVEMCFRFQEARDSESAINEHAPSTGVKEKKPVPFTPAVAKKTPETHTQKTTPRKSSPKAPADVPPKSRKNLPIGTRGKPQNASSVLPQKPKERSEPTSARTERPKEERKIIPKTRPPWLPPAANQKQGKGTIDDAKKTPEKRLPTIPQKSAPKDPAVNPPKSKKNLPIGTRGKPENASSVSPQKPKERSEPTPARTEKPKEERKIIPKTRPPCLLPATSQKQSKGTIHDAKKTPEKRLPTIPQKSAPKDPAVNPPSRRPTTRVQAAPQTSVLPPIPPIPQKKGTGSQQQTTIPKKSVPKWDDSATLPVIKGLRKPAIPRDSRNDHQCPQLVHQRPQLVQIIHRAKITHTVFRYSP
uniref:proteoglycan 4-like isoform X1 n=1 Tax=Gasterosteus aculeatus aculeatus TaxID=481459 RepID=UPI001A99C028|nr:proteoglycan 4-like isoform X1 [Gasterosteus aculeatus aculeatus]XP_040023777.1 proteoglycan 4-like isoform X1 [Gasterosteus aculeatus aculeatus]